MSYLFFTFLLFLICASAQELTVDLKHPEYCKGVLLTREGGIISSPDFRIQGREISYTHTFGKKGEVHQVIAEGDLFFTSHKYTYVGRRLEYDFITKTGVLYDGTAAFDVWFLRGETIRLSQDRSLHFSNAFVTTSENQNPNWKIQIKEGEINAKHLLAARKISFRLLDFPIFYLPTFKSNLKTFTHSPIRYKISQDSGLYPKLSLRYCIYSWETLAIYLRFNIRPAQGVGGALETVYRSSDKHVQFRTRNYIDRDAFYWDIDPKRARTHYRMQGTYTATSANKGIEFLATYDYLSDKNMQADFESKDFELKTAKETKIRIRNYQEKRTLGIDGDFRINAFQGMLQKLPEVFSVSKPFQLGPTGILLKNHMKGGYLSYVSAKDLQGSLPSFSSLRLSAHQSLYRPFYCHGLSMTPILGLDGVFYGATTEKNHPALLTICTYQLLTDLTLKRRYQAGLHVLAPYLHYQGMRGPKPHSPTPYLFSIEDGFHRLNLIKFGIRNLFYLKKFSLFEPNILADFSLYSFLGNVPFKKRIPKLQGTLTWNFPDWSLTSSLGWNMEKQVLDYANVRFAWTMSAHCALYSELRHRSSFDWRRADRENFIMEVTQPISHLCQSPLSDRRNTFLTRFQLKPHPEWVIRFESHIGWGREKEPSYQEAKLQLITTIVESWRLSLSAIHSLTPSQNNNRYYFSFSLIKKRR